MLTSLKIPPTLTRNHASIRDATEQLDAGEYLIKAAMQEGGIDTLADKRILDVGCGTRFTSTFINRSIPIKFYRGIEVYDVAFRFLRNKVQKRDRRFSYKHWNVVNDLYNPEGEPLTEDSKLPLWPWDKYHQIWMFSVITHQYPDDTLALLKMLKRHCRPDGTLVFTAFIDENVDRFVDALPETPLMVAVYSKSYMDELLEKAGWRVINVRAPHEKWHQHMYVCSKE